MKEFDGSLDKERISVSSNVSTRDTRRADGTDLLSSVARESSKLKHERTLVSSNASTRHATSHVAMLWGGSPLPFPASQNILLHMSNLWVLQADTHIQHRPNCLSRLSSKPVYIIFNSPIDG